MATRARSNKSGKRDTVRSRAGKQYAKLDTWQRPDEVARLARIAVFARPGIELEESVRLIPMEPLHVSASEIRARAARGESPGPWAREEEGPRAPGRRVRRRCSPSMRTPRPPGLRGGCSSTGRRRCCTPPRAGSWRGVASPGWSSAIWPGAESGRRRRVRGYGPHPGSAQARATTILRVSLVHFPANRGGIRALERWAKRFAERRWAISRERTIRPEVEDRVVDGGTVRLRPSGDRVETGRRDRHASSGSCF